MNISSDKLEEFTVLFEEFINSYPNTSKGIKHIKSYSQQRESGRRNYQAILEAEEAGEDITERVLLQLLPYKDTANNREQGAWIHIAPAINKDLKVWFENSRWASPEDWHKVAELIFYFINYSVEETETLSVNCQNFHRSAYSKGLQTGFMTPILNAIKPDDFILINNKSRVVINHFADTNYSHKLIEYPAINKIGWQLIKDLDSIMDRFDLPALRQDDLFDMFCHWLVTEKKYNFKSGLEQYNSKENNKVLEIHPESYFGDTLFIILDSIDDNGLTLNEIELNNLKLPFVEFCSDVFENIPSYIKKRLNLAYSIFEEEFDNQPKTDFKYKSSSIVSISDFNIQISLYIFYDFYCFDIGIFIRTEENLFKTKLLQNINLTKSHFSYLEIEHISEALCLFSCSEQEKKKINEIFQCFSNIEFDYKNNIGYSALNQCTKISLKKALKSSRKVLIDLIIETLNYFYLLILLVISENPKQEIEEHLRIWNPKYKLEKYVDATYIEESQLKTWIKSITRKKQAIFYGSPGTGKTFIAENIAQYLIGGGDGFYELIQFHPAYSYEDFIQGIRPQTRDDGQLSYSLVPGRFLEFCNKAAACKDKCILIIDEINRANLAEVFGELMYLLEYREQEICLAGSQEKFKIPDNVYLIGTMNTADRSIALVDFALRRRFAFIKIAPNYDIITKFHQQHTHLEVTGLITVLREINNLIEDENYYLGISFFLIETLTEDLENIWQMEIEPYLEEYFCNSIEQIIDYRWEKIKDRILPLKKTNT